VARSGTRGWRWAGLIVVVAGALLWLLSRPVEIEPDPGRGRPAARNGLTRRATAPAIKHEGGAISGRVVDPDGRGVAAAIVSLVGPAPARDGAAARLFRTGRDGTFRFDRLAPGRYRAQAKALHFTAGFHDNLGVEAGETLDDVRIQLWAGGITLTGRVLDAGGGFIPGARVGATSYVRTAQETHDARAFHADADGEGRYRLELPRGRHTLSAGADGYAPVSESGYLTGDQTRDFVLQPAARISGRVLSSEGRTPVPGARVSAQRRFQRGSPAESPGSVTTDDLGGFVFGSVAPGTYAVTARKEGLLGTLAEPIVVGATDAVDDLELFVSPTLAMRGRVTSTSGKPVAGARVNLAAVDEPERALGPVAPGIADAEGRYLVEGFLPGIHRFVVSANGYGTQAEPISISADLERDVVLRDTAVVTGIVLTASGRPAQRALVQGSLGRSKPSDGDPAVAFTDAEGRFVLTGLGGGGALVVTARNGSEVAVAGPEALEPSGRKQVTIRFGAGAGVAGAVSWDDGSPLVAVVKAVLKVDDATRFEIDVPTAGHGTFAIHGLPPGGILLRAAPLGRRIVEAPEGQPGPDQASLTLEAGEQKTGLKLVVARR
jgi:protocatechuate 3,4-dioxygenase beta subunit